MAGLNSKILSKRLLSLKLATREQLDACIGETGDAPSPDELLRVMERKSLLTPLQIEKLKKGETTGFLLGGYRLLYKVASGSFGRVYRGDNPKDGRIVAIKVLRKRWSESPESIELFEREARLGMSLKHPNIVEILTVGKDSASKQHFIVMEFVEGGNLRDFLAIRRKLEPVEALRLMEGISAGLSYAAMKGVTHRDIKLTNILISSQGEAKVVDFGLAKVQSSTVGKSLSDDVDVQRTVDYAGLEKATGAPPGDPRSDVYFLGCVLYEMLTGRAPLMMTRDKQARMDKKRFESVQPLTPEEVNGSTAVLSLIENMMTLQPAKRYQNASQLLQAVREAKAECMGAAVKAEIAGTNSDGPPRVFLLERDMRLQEAIRDKLKSLGYRVLVASDPGQAVARYNREGFACLIVDAGTTHREGVAALHRILEDSRDKNTPVGGILIFSENQEELRSLIEPRHQAVVLTRPLKLGQLVEHVRELAPIHS